MIKTKKSITLPKLLKKAQIVFNKWIRNRDKDKGCVSCGGEIHHAGHYRAQGNFSSLRFNEMNCQGQCLPCNYHKHGNLIEYRKGLVSRYGEEKVLWLENVKPMKKWTRFELEQIIRIYK